jgi:hypothetical protein
MENTARIVLNRSSEWINRVRSFKVLIDGQEAGRISNGATEQFPVAAGTHMVGCKVDWCGSNDYELNLQHGETAYVHVKSGMKYYWQFTLPLFVMLLLNFFFTVAKMHKPAWFNILLILICVPAAIYILYYTLFNRKAYLVITKDDKTLFGK